MRGRHWRRAATLSAVVVAAAAGLVAAPATAAHAQAACRVDYQIRADWNAGMTVDLTITNLGESVDGWTLAFAFSGNQQISNGWNAIWSQNGAEVTAESLPWNAGLGTDAATTIGFNAGYSGSGEPGSFTLNGVSCTGGTEQNEPPVVTLTSPEEGWSDVLGCEIQFAADASDPDGEITLVEFYLNGNLVAAVDEAPYEFERPALSGPGAIPGENTAFARAYDSGSPPRSTDSPAVTFLQTDPPPAPPGVERCRTGVPPVPPQVTLTSPEDEAVFPTPCAIPLAADASDDGAVTLVEFYLNDVLVGSDGEAPYAIDVPPDHPALADPATSSNTVYARAYDNDIPPSLGSSSLVTFFRVIPPPSVAVLACATELAVGEGGTAALTYVLTAAAVSTDVELTVTGTAGVAVTPTSFTVDDSGQEVTVTAAPDSAGQTATIQGVSADGFPVSTVTVTVVP